MMALKALGYSMNTEDPGQLKEAYDWLVQCVQTMKPEIVMDEDLRSRAYVPLKRMLEWSK